MDKRRFLKRLDAPTDTVSEKTSSTSATTSTHDDGVTEAAASSQLTSSSSQAAPIHCTARQGDNTDDLGEKQASSSLLCPNSPQNVLAV